MLHSGPLDSTPRISRSSTSASNFDEGNGGKRSARKRYAFQGKIQSKIVLVTARTAVTELSLRCCTPQAHTVHICHTSSGRGRRHGSACMGVVEDVSCYVCCSPRRNTPNIRLSLLLPPSRPWIDHAPTEGTLHPARGVRKRLSWRSCEDSSGLRASRLQMLPSATP